MRLNILLFIIIALTSCKSKEEVQNLSIVEKPKVVNSDNSNLDFDNTFDTSKWIEITEDQGFHLNLKYATNDNFTGQKLYNCGRCFLETKTAYALIAAQNFIKEKYNLSFVIFDCYRPLSVQQKLWDIKPDASYVTPPSKGSMHNRGMAVDISIVDSLNVDFEMGTSYDYFGREAHIDFIDFSENILDNRKFLQTVLSKYGFKSIRTEWWHFSHQSEINKIEDWTWKC